MELNPELWGLEVNDKDHLIVGGCDSVELDDQYGTPLYVINEARLEGNFNRFNKSFKSKYPKV